MHYHLNFLSFVLQNDSKDLCLPTTLHFWNLRHMLKNYLKKNLKSPLYRIPYWVHANASTHLVQSILPIPLWKNCIFTKISNFLCVGFLWLHLINAARLNFWVDHKGVAGCVPAHIMIFKIKIWTKGIHKITNISFWMYE